MEPSISSVKFMPMVSNLVHSHADKLSDLGIIHVVHAYGVCIEGKGTYVLCLILPSSPFSPKADLIFQGEGRGTKTLHLGRN